jgi:DNA-binding NtrC family response regulator
MARAPKRTRKRKSRENPEEQKLRNDVERLLERLTAARRPWALRRARRAFERAYVEYIIGRAEGDRQLAADKLDIGFSTLKEKIRKS